MCLGASRNLRIRSWTRRDVSGTAWSRFSVRVSSAGGAAAGADAVECARLREAYGVAYRKYFEERLPGHGYPCRYTVHLVDSPDTAASYEFYSVGLLQGQAPAEPKL